MVLNAKDLASPVIAKAGDNLRALANHAKALEEVNASHAGKEKAADYFARLAAAAEAMKKSKKPIEDMAAAVGKTKEPLEATAKVAKEAEATFMGMSAEKFGEKLAEGLIEVFTELKDLFIDLNNEEQHFKLGLEGLVDTGKTTFGSAFNQVDEIVEGINKIAVNSPFAAKTMQSVSQQMLAAGYTGDNLIDTFQKLSDVAASTSDGSFVSMALALKNVKEQGRASAASIEAFTNSGVAFRKFIGTKLDMPQVKDESADAFNIRLSRSLETMTITGDKFNKWFDEFAETQKGKGAEAGKTFAGSLNRVNEAFKQMILYITAPAFTQLSGQLSALADFMTGEKKFTPVEFFKGLGEGATGDSVKLSQYMTKTAIAAIRMMASDPHIGLEAVKAVMVVYASIVGSLELSVISAFAYVGTALYTAMGAIAMDILQGIHDGLVAGFTFLTAPIVRLATFVIDTFKNVFGIHSPSKVMAEQVGLPLAQGLATGLMNGLGFVQGITKTFVSTFGMMFLKLLQTDLNGLLKITGVPILVKSLQDLWKLTSSLFVAPRAELANLGAGVSTAIASGVTGSESDNQSIADKILAMLQGAAGLVSAVALGAAFGPIGLVVGAATAAAVLAQSVGLNVGTVANAIGTFIGNSAAAVGSTFGAIASGAATVAGNVGSALVTGVGNLIRGVQTGSLGASVGNFIGDSMGFIASTYTGLASGASTAASNTIKAISTGVGNLVTGVQTGSLGEAIGNFAGNTMGFITSTFTNIVTGSGTVASNIAKAISTGVGGLVTGVQTGSVGSSIGTFIGNTMGFITSTAANIPTGASTIANSISNAISTGISGVVTGIQQGSVGQAIATYVGNTMGFITSNVTNLVSGASTIANSIAQSIASGVSKVQTALTSGSLADTVATWVSNVLRTVTDVDLASGAQGMVPNIVKAITMAVAGISSATLGTAAFLSSMAGVADNILKGIVTRWDILRGAIITSDTYVGLQNFLSTLGATVVNYIPAPIAGIGTAIINAIATGIKGDNGSITNAIFNMLNTALNWINNHQAFFKIPFIPYLVDPATGQPYGGYQQGVVKPLSAQSMGVSSMGGQSGQTIQTTLVVNDQVLGNVVWQYLKGQSNYGANMGIASQGLVPAGGG